VPKKPSTLVIIIGITQKLLTSVMKVSHHQHILAPITLLDMSTEQTALSNVALSNTSMTLNIANQLGTGVLDQDQIMLPSVIYIDTQKHTGDIQERDRLDNESWSS
jgi:hypothetical protein